MAACIKVTAGKRGVLCVILRRMSSRPNYDNIETRKLLSKYKGGSIDLVQDNLTGLATLTINNPSKKNALTGQMMVDFQDKVTELETWTAGKGLILQGASDTFCSGADLDLVKQILKPDIGFLMSNFMHETMTRLSNLPIISVAVVKGAAFGGGAELPLACDFRLMMVSAKLGFIHTKMGVIPGFGGGTRLTKLLGKRLALHLLCSGQIMDSSTAHRIGLVDTVIPLSEDAQEFAKLWMLNNYCSLSPLIINCVKRTTLGADNLDAESAFSMERNLFAKVWGGEEQISALHKNFKHK